MLKHWLIIVMASSIWDIVYNIIIIMSASRPAIHKQ